MTSTSAGLVMCASNPGAETRSAVAGFKSVHVMLAKETFFGLGASVFDEETRSVVEWLGRYPSFGGIAIHYYDTFRELVEGK